MHIFIKLIIRLALNKTEKQMHKVQIFLFILVCCNSLTCFNLFCDANETCKMVISLWILKAYITRYSGAVFRKGITKQMSLNFHMFCGFLLINT